MSYEDWYLKHKNTDGSCMVALQNADRELAEKEARIRELEEDNQKLRSLLTVDQENKYLGLIE